MEIVDFNYLQKTLDLAIDSRLVVQSWLGYANVLFFGIGDEVIPAVKTGESHPVPPYELQTNYSMWSVEDETGVIATSEDEGDKAYDAIQRFVGKHITKWNLLEDSLSLVIHCENNLVLRIIPYNDTDLMEKDAWFILLPDENYVVVRCDLEIYIKQE